MVRIFHEEKKIVDMLSYESCLCEFCREGLYARSHLDELREIILFVEFGFTHLVNYKITQKHWKRLSLIALKQSGENLIPVQAGL